MEWLFLILIIAVPILSVLGWLFWITVIGFAAKKSYDALNGSPMAGAFGGMGGAGDLNALFAQLDQMLRASAASSGGRGGGPKNMSPEQQLRIQAILMQAQNQMAQMNSLSRQRYETRMADLSGMAASAGIDWTPPSY